MIIASLIILNLICFYVIYINYNKVSYLQDTVDELESDNDKLLSFISSLNTRLHIDYSHLKEIDRRGSFESDDEVGFVFDTIKSIIEDSFKIVNDFLKTIESNAEEEELE